MKIRTKSHLNTVFLVVIILMIGLTLLFAYHKMNTAIEKEKAIDDLITGVFELNLMTHDYLLNHGTRAITQWQTRYDSLGKVLSTGFQTNEENLLLEEIKENHGKLKPIFSKLTIDNQSWSDRRKMPGGSKQLESRLVGHLMTRLQTMVSIGNQLAQRSDRELMSIQRGASLVIMISIIILALIAVNSILMGRSIVRPIRKLQKDTEIVGKGNLDYPMATAANDELGELSRSFEQMAKNLKTVMASRDELEDEIEERKQAEAGLKESEEKYSKLFHSNPQWLHISTLEDGRYVEVNETIKEIMGYEPDEVIGRTSEELGFWADYEERSGLVKVAKEQGGFREQEVTFIKKNGEPVSLLWSAATIEIMGTVCLINTVTDITELKQTQEALRESEEQYRTLMDNLPVAVYRNTPGPEGQFLMANPAFCKMFGFKNEEEVKKITPASLYQNPEERKQYSDNLIQKGVFKNDERALQKRDGTPVYTSITSRLVYRKDGEVSHFDSIMLDITEQKLAEEENKRLEAQLQQAQKMEAIATLAGGVAHEFNNALMGVMGNIELLEMELSEDERRDKYFEAMKDSGHRMSRLTDQLLAYAQGGKYQPRDLKLDDFVIETLPILQHDINPEVRVETHFQKVSYINADNAQMQMVLSAILANSNEAIEDEGFIRITAENKDLDEDFTKQHPGLKPGYYVCLTIEDNGKGMDEETRSGIFEPFFTTKFQGRGMGMAAVYGIIKSHDGAITVDSEPDKGTVVRIYLPAISAESKEQGAKAVKQPPVELATGEGTILVIEDEEPLMELFRQILERLGYRMLQAKTGKEAVEFAKTFDGQIDLALLDIKLPDMEGGKIYPLIMEARPDLKVIVCSGYSIHGPAQDILDAGAEGFIQKPFLIAAFADKLKEVL